MADKRLWVLAGGNGAGKSTFYRTRLAAHGVEFVNVDEIEKTLAADAPNASYEAATLARERFRDHLEQGHSFCHETVFSHRSKLDMITSAKAAGYEVNLVVIHLARPELNVLRVRQRVSERGHPVPEEKIRSRIPRTLVLLKEAVQVADCSLLFDNSRHDDPYRPIARSPRSAAPPFGCWSNPCRTGRPRCYRSRAPECGPSDRERWEPTGPKRKRPHHELMRPRYWWRWGPHNLFFKPLIYI